MVRDLEGSLGKWYMNRFLWLGNDVKIFGSHVNEWEEDLNTHIDDQFWGYQSAFFLSNSCYYPWAHKTKWPWPQKWRLCVGSATWTFTHLKCPVYSYCWRPSLPVGKTNTESPKWPHSLGDTAFLSLHSVLPAHYHLTDGTYRAPYASLRYFK